ncbi:hypothetical protein So717_19180 [Roseobacter cerasinus]|uniref:Uncharacterized protein n=1 Tax=Roseobacter cerasinus TaxID=2602289 RepID=A0A640VTD6_9RHOB|nr:hypothetical protein [Roseobacter cerasinus]GFE50165.1 hypothetical protein So717_19180 [Roseobacter cerasinus]
MTNIHWAILALRDINCALDRNRYDVASHHIDDAIFAIMARDAQDAPKREAARRSGAQT